MPDETDSRASASDELEMALDHDQIKTWATARDATPVRMSSGDSSDLAFVPQGNADDAAEQLSWEAFFDAFEDESLVLLYDSDTDDPTEADLVDREGHYRS